MDFAVKKCHSKLFQACNFSSCPTRQLDKRWNQHKFTQMYQECHCHGRCGIPVENEKQIIKRKTDSII